MRGIPEGQIDKFRLYPDPARSRCYYLVRVFRSLRLMRRWAVRGCRRTGMQHAAGIALAYTVRTYAKGGGGHTKPIQGEILFCRTRVDVEVLMHEICHAALFWNGSRRKHLLSWNERDPNETVCYAMGRMATQITKRATKTHDWGMGTR